MRDQVELSAAIQTAMKKKKISPEGLRKRLGVSAIMVTKIMCGEVVPSGHLEKQMIEILEISPDRVKNLAARRRHGASAAMTRETRTRKAA
jgi:ribosome-binding protein aMBF1 (putative translation factor)